VGNCSELRKFTGTVLERGKEAKERDGENTSETRRKTRQCEVNTETHQIIHARMNKEHETETATLLNDPVIDGHKPNK
jgi:hypothetical protein